MINSQANLTNQYYQSQANELNNKFVDIISDVLNKHGLSQKTEQDLETVLNLVEQASNRFLKTAEQSNQLDAKQRENDLFYLKEMINLALELERNSAEILEKRINSLKEIAGLISRPNHQISSINIQPSVKDSNPCTQLNEEAVKELVFRLEKTKSPIDQHIKFYKSLSDEPSNEPLRKCYLDALTEQNIRKALLQIPNKDGLRRAQLEEIESLQKAILEITQSTSYPNAVKVSAPFFSGERYLKKEASVLTNFQGDIRNDYQSQHNVARLKLNAIDLHFKQADNPLIEYGIYTLLYRIMGKGSPANTFLQFEVGNKKYPVLVSESIEGEVLEDKFHNNKFNTAQLTWHLLCTILTRPGNGIREHFITNKDMIYSINNSRSYVNPIYPLMIPVVNAAYQIKVHFLSILFFLDPKLILDDEVIENFCALDPISILTGWIDDLIIQDQKYRTLFPNDEQYFYPTPLFFKRDLATLHVQFTTLQHFLKNKKEICAFDLLESLIYLKETFGCKSLIGQYVAYYYRNATKRSSPEYSLLEVEHSNPPRPEEISALLFGRIPTFEETINRKRITLQEAKNELKIFEEFLSNNIGKVTGPEGFSLHGYFENYKKSSLSVIENQTMVLNRISNILKSSIELKPSGLILSNCIVLDKNNLKPFLHPDLKVLDITSCIKIDNAALQLTINSCPNLEELYISGCSNLDCFETGTYIKKPIHHSKLKALELANCPTLKTLNFTFPQLKELNIYRNPKLSTIKNATIGESVAVLCIECPSLNYDMFLQNILNINFNNENSHILKSFSKMLKNRSQKISIKGNLSLSAANTLIIGIKKIRSISMLIIKTNTSISNETAKILASELEENASIKTLNFHDTCFDTGSFKLIMNCLKINNTITNLQLSNNNLGNKEARILSKSLEKNSTITELDLSGNNIGSVGVESLAKILDEKSNIIQLNLSKNSIDKEGIKVLASTMEINKKLMTLYFHNNPIDNDGATYLINSLKKNNTLSRLTIDSNCFNDFNRSLLLGSLFINKHPLLNIGVYSESKFWSKENISLLKIALKLSSLTQITLDLNLLEGEDFKILNESINKNSSIFIETILPNFFL